MYITLTQKEDANLLVEVQSNSQRGKWGWGGITMQEQSDIQKSRNHHHLPALSFSVGRQTVPEHLERPWPEGGRQWAEWILQHEFPLTCSSTSGVSCGDLRAEVCETEVKTNWQKPDSNVSFQKPWSCYLEDFRKETLLLSYSDVSALEAKFCLVPIRPISGRPNLETIQNSVDGHRLEWKCYILTFSWNIHLNQKKKQFISN